MFIIKQYTAGIAAAFGAFCMAAAMGWSGPVEQPILMGDAYKFKPSIDEWGWTASLLTLGAACMCFPVGCLIAAFGRKLIMLVLVIPFLLGWLLICGAQNIAMLLIGRFLLGVSGGSFCFTVPIYTTEIAEINSRGILGCFFQLFYVLGVLYSFIAGSLVNVMIFNIMCAILPIIFFMIFVWMPESPVYLAQKGKIAKAEKSLKWLRDKNADISDEMAVMILEGQRERTSFRKALSRKATLKGLFIAIMLLAFQQFTGINAILFYVTGIFRDAGTGLSDSINTIIIGIVGVLATIPSVLLIETAGRRILLIISGALMFLTTLTMGFYFRFLKHSHVGWLPLAAICLFIIGLQLGFGPVPWLIMAELFAQDVKPYCAAIVGTCSWLFAFCVTKLFLICLNEFGSAVTFWGFSAISFMACIFVIIFVPETKGKTLDEIQTILNGKYRCILFK